MFSIYSKVTTPETSPILGPTPSPTQSMEPLDSNSQQEEQQQQDQQHLIDKMGGIGLLCACCSRRTHGIAPLTDTINNITTAVSIQTNAPMTDVLEKCKHETHFTHYNYRAITPRQMPPF